MAQFKFMIEYTCCVCEDVELEGVDSWDDIERYWIKWDTLFYIIKGDETTHQYPLGDLDYPEVDYKRPTHVVVTDGEHVLDEG